MKKNKKGNYNKTFKKPIKEIETKESLIKDISGSKERLSIVARVNRVVQTGGPTVFVVSDVPGSFSFKGFIGPG